MKEVACEDNNKCNVDQRAFKAFFSRWMAASTKVAPWLTTTLMGRLKTSAEAAIKTCSGGVGGYQCGLKWTTGAFDGPGGVGEQMSALEVTQSMLALYVDGPATTMSGGTTKVDVSLGTKSKAVASGAISTADRAGAGILTAIVLLSLLSGSRWVVSEEN
jgi:mannan endo-1,6-alpha-mannosidase